MNNTLLARLMLTLFCASLSISRAQSTAFTYQGHLADNGSPAIGSYDLRFSLWSAATGPAQLGSTLTSSATAVSNGLFTVTLDFGNQFSGADRWLEISAHTNGSGAFTTLSPRQSITPTPYAIFSATATMATTAGSANSVAASNISGTIPLVQLPATLITNGASGVNLSGSFSGTGAGLTNLNPANLIAGTAAINISGNAATATTATTANNFTGNVADGQLSTNIARVNGTNVFTATNRFAGVLVATNTSNQLAGSFTGTGSGLISLNPTNLAAGTAAINISGNAATATTATTANNFTGNVADSQLSPNIARLDGTNVFTATNLFVGALAATNASNQLSGRFTGDGGGLTNVPGSLVPSLVAGTRVTAQPNDVYYLSNDSTVTVTLPVTANTGDLVQINGSGAGGWLIDGYGIAWTPRDSSRAWEAVASSADGTKLVAATFGGQIYTSTDSGVTWTAQNSGGRMWESVASSADGTKLVGVVYNGQIYTSTDSGVTWTPRESNRPWWSVASSSDGTKLVAVDRDGTSGLGGRIYTSTDSGATWTPRESNRVWYSVASSTDGTKLVAAVFDGQIYTSTDSGLTWTPRENNRTWYGVASSADGTKLVAVVSQDGQIYTSTDSGLTWTPRGSNNGWWSVASSADGTKLVAITGGYQIYTSTDSGATWTARESNRSWDSVASSSDGTKLVAVAYEDHIYTSVDPVDSGAQGTSAQFQYVGNGVWQHLKPTGTFIGDGSGLASLNASNLTTGTVADARLSSNVPLLTRTNVFTATNRFAGVVIATNTSNQLVGTHSGNGAGLTSLNPTNLTAGTAAINISGNAATATTASNVTGNIADNQLSTNVPFLNGSNAFTATDRFAGVVVATNTNNQLTGTHTGDGSGLTSLNANNISSGTVSDTRLSGNVALLNRSIQSFTGGTNSFSGNVGIGTTTPQAKLQVAGDIKLGSSGQYFAPSGEENLRIIRGSVSATGALVAGSGFTPSRTASATYSISFATAFSSNPSVVVTCGAAGQTVNSQDVPTVTSASTTGFTVVIGVRNIGFSDEPFSFIAIGPR